MFADSLLDNNWDNRSHRGWTTLASFALQALWVGIVLLLPLLYTEGLPQLQLMGNIAAPSPPAPSPPTRPRSSSTSHQSNLMGNHLMQISQIPRVIQNIVETEPPPTREVFGTGVPGGTGMPGSTVTVLDSLDSSNFAAPMLRPSAPPPRVSRIMEGSLIYKVQPSYPALAKATRVQGQVVLRAVISRTGTIESLQVVSGHPLLVRAAIDAVRQWRYRPYVLNGDPVEVETEVTVNFVLSGG